MGVACGRSRTVRRKVLIKAMGTAKGGGVSNKVSRRSHSPMGRVIVIGGGGERGCIHVHWVVHSSTTNERDVIENLR